MDAIHFIVKLLILLWALYHINKVKKEESINNNIYHGIFGIGFLIVAFM